MDISIIYVYVYTHIWFFGMLFWRKWGVLYMKNFISLQVSCHCSLGVTKGITYLLTWRCVCQHTVQTICLFVLPSFHPSIENILKSKRNLIFMFLSLCSYCELWLISVYYYTNKCTYKQYKIDIKIALTCFGVNTPSSGSFQFVPAKVMIY